MAFPTLFPTVAPTMVGQKASSGRIRVFAKKEPNMFSKYAESGVACAVGALALVFACLTVGAALSPLMAA